VFALVGRLDQGTHAAVESAVNAWLEAPTDRLCFDCRELAYVSSAGLRTLLMTAKSLKKTGRAFVMYGLSPMVQEVFQISGFDQIIRIVADEQAALAAA
jgi:anti-anti-sigma factor